MYVLWHKSPDDSKYCENCEKLLEGASSRTSMVLSPDAKKTQKFCFHWYSDYLDLFLSSPDRCFLWCGELRCIP